MTVFQFIFLRNLNYFVTKMQKNKNQSIVSYLAIWTGVNFIFNFFLLIPCIVFSIVCNCYLLMENYYFYWKYILRHLNKSIIEYY